MKRQRNLVQTKISQTPEKGPNETELTNVLERVQNKNHKHAYGGTEKFQEVRDEFKSEIQSLRNFISEMKHTMEGFKSRLDEVKEMVNDIEMREQEYKEADTKREKRISRNERETV